MAAEGEAAVGEAAVPAVAGAEGRGVVEQAVPLFLGGEAGELRRQRVARGQEGLLAVEDGVCRMGLVVAVELAGAERRLDAAG